MRSPSEQGVGSRHNFTARIPVPSGQNERSSQERECSQLTFPLAEDRTIAEAEDVHQDHRRQCRH